MQKANLEGASQFIPSSEWTDMVNVSYAEFYDKVRSTPFGGQYYRRAYSFQTVGAQQSYLLPADFLSLISVDMNPANGQSICVYPYQEEDRNMFKATPFFGVGVAPYRYQLQGPFISFIPLPAGANTIALNYTPVAAQLTSDDDVIDSINGWDEWIVLDVAIKALVKDGQMDMVPSLMQMRDLQAARIADAAASRMQTQNETVHDVVGSSGGWWS